MPLFRCLPDFYPRSPCGERHAANISESKDGQISIHALLAESDPRGQLPTPEPPDFYPRSPCGERHPDGRVTCCEYEISIHALLAESDVGRGPDSPLIRHFYPRSPCGERHHIPKAHGRAAAISIHALLAESDLADCTKFYPIGISIHALLAESDGNPRGCTFHRTSFLSTLSLRRATAISSHGHDV